MLAKVTFEHPFTSAEKLSPVDQPENCPHFDRAEKVATLLDSPLKKWRSAIFSSS
jgi:hypothetical protein